MNQIYGVIFVVGLIAGLGMSELLQKIAVYNFSKKGK